VYAVAASASAAMFQVLVFQIAAPVPSYSTMLASFWICITVPVVLPDDRRAVVAPAL
jgi:hypothetical protein